MTSNMDMILLDLTCPITLELFEDPISVPCCGKTFSRIPLYQCFESRQETKCPLCNANLSDFDIMNTAKNTTIAGMVDTISKSSPSTVESSNIASTSTSNSTSNSASASVSSLDHIWTCELTPLYNKHNVRLPIANLTLSLEKSRFQVKSSLFIFVVDNSGSMWGNPWNQVKIALTHIIAMSKSTPTVKIIIIVYNSTASIIPINLNNEADTYRVINSLNAGGGTNFQAAFDKVRDVLVSERIADTNDQIGIANIVFLTDGQDVTRTDKVKLVSDFKTMLSTTWSNPISVHSVGFSSACDMNLLENLYNSGTVAGTMRYAEPSDPDDLLCSKLQSLFDMTTKASTIQLNIAPTNSSMKFKVGNNYTSIMDVQYPIDSNKTGSKSFWVKLDTDDDDNNEIRLNSILDTDLVVSVITNINKDTNDKLFNRWISSVLDDVAAEILYINSIKQTTSANILDLHCSIILQKLNVICIYEDLSQRVKYLSDQVYNIKSGLSVNVGKLNDMMFASMFIQPIGNNTTKSSSTSVNPTYKHLQLNYSELKETSVHYSRNNTHKQRNSLQEAICDNPFNRITDEIRSKLYTSTMDDILHTDIDGNTVLHLVAYCGQTFTLEKILDKYDIEPIINNMNIHNETPMTLAIKKNGYWNTINILLNHGGLIPSIRIKALEQYALDNEWSATVEIISNYGDPSVDVHVGMTPDYIRFQYHKALANHISFDVESYLTVCLTKGYQMIDIIKLLLKIHNAIPTFELLMTHCIPPKPDAADTADYIELAKLLLKYNPVLIHQTDAVSGDTPLMTATVKGSLPHVRLFIHRGGNQIVDKTNLLGNTALWLACMKGYPCIVSELLNKGANVNHINHKGNPPIYSVCQRGPLKIAETLIAHGAHVQHINSNGDTLILICCRNGQHKILELLLDYVNQEFVDHKAHVDGFNAIMASAEANRPECIKVLFDYGIDINQKTDDDNMILASATPLHIATYYERFEAVKMLLEIGADVNAVDIYQQTPLHTAVIQGNVDVIRYLKTAGAVLTSKDYMGNTPLAYCRDRSEVQKALEDPGVESLMRLAKGCFTKEEQNIAFKLLAEHTGVIGCLTTKETIDVVTYDGCTPLLQAVIHSNYFVVKTLLELGADPRIKNIHGLDCNVWAIFGKNPRIIDIVSKHYICDNEQFDTNRYVSNMETTIKEYPQHKQILFMSNKPTSWIPLVSSGIDVRMEYGIMNMVDDGEEIHSIFDLLNSPAIASTSTMASTSVPLIVDWSPHNLVIINKEDNVEENICRNFIWQAKLFTINVIASSSIQLNPQHVMALALYTNNSLFCRSVYAINDNTPGNITSYIQSVYSALVDIPPYVNEVFVGANNVDRYKFKIGSTVGVSSFLSSSTMWRIAVENVKEYSTKKIGTIFIINSKSGRHISTYSQFAFDCEVIFMPGTKFVVTQWYRGGDFIVLGQKNIRSHTYGIKEADIHTMLNNNKSLVIELQEM